MAYKGNRNMDRPIKTRAPKRVGGWRSVSIPDDIYEKIQLMSNERQESVSLIVRRFILSGLKSS